MYNMKLWDMEKSPVEFYKKELKGYLTPNGNLCLPNWMAAYLPLLGGASRDVKLLSRIESFLNVPPENNEHVILQNVYLNLIIMLIRMKEYNVVVL